MGSISIEWRWRSLVCGFAGRGRGCSRAVAHVLPRLGEARRRISQFARVVGGTGGIHGKGDAQAFLKKSGAESASYCPREPSPYFGECIGPMLSGQFSGLSGRAPATTEKGLCVRKLLVRRFCSELCSLCVPECRTAEVLPFLSSCQYTRRSRPCVRQALAFPD